MNLDLTSPHGSVLGFVVIMEEKSSDRMLFLSCKSGLYYPQLRDFGQNPSLSGSPFSFIKWGLDEACLSTLFLLGLFHSGL